MLTRRQWLGALALFALTVLVRLPVRWVAPLLPAEAHCMAPSGSIWFGHCARAGAGALLFNDVSWTLQPWLLLTGRLGAHVRSADPDTPLECGLRYGPGGRVELRELKGSVAIGSGRLPVFPDGWSGTLLLDLSSVDLRADVLERIVGVLDADGLRQGARAAELGSYQLRFEQTSGGASGVQGTLRDTSGPLAVAAHLQIGRNGAYELSGTVMARPAASASLGAAVAALGQPDASGRRQFSLAGSF